MERTNIISRRGALVASVIAMLGLAACASGPKVFVNENPAADFASYKTYNYEAALGTDDRKGYRSILSNHLIAATDREMQAKGYTRADAPDLLINFYVHSKEKVRTTSTPSMGGYYGYRGGYYGAYSGYDTQVTQYTEGTLNIDIVEKRSAELAWEGVAVGRITDEVRNNMKAAADAAVGEVFSRFKHTAPGFVPPVTAAGEDNG